ncbi:MAG: GNAT family N-acetyltransferase [Hyphomicrobiales bacterium]
MTTIVSLPALETQSLILRELRLKDVRNLAGFMTQPRYQRHISHRLRDEAAVADFVRRQVAVQGDQRRQIFHLAAEEKMSGDAVGEGFIISHGNGEYEVGWGVHPAMWSMGLGTEIGRALLALCFERLRATAVWCKVMAPNTASATVARRIGMSLSGGQDDYPVGQGRTERVDIFRLAVASYFDLPY